MIGAAAIFSLVVGILVVFPIYGVSTPAETHEPRARDLCREEITARLAVPTDEIRFVDEQAEEHGENTWNVTGTAELGWTDRREYACTYTGGEIVDTTVDESSPAQSREQP